MARVHKTEFHRREPHRETPDICRSFPSSIQSSTGEHICGRKLPNVRENSNPKGLKGVVPEAYTEPEYCLIPIAKLENLMNSATLGRVLRKFSPR